MEELEHGELEQSLVELEEGEHDGEIHVFRVVRREHVRRHPRHRLAHDLKSKSKKYGKNDSGEGEKYWFYHRGSGPAC